MPDRPDAAAALAAVSRMIGPSTSNGMSDRAAPAPQHRTSRIDEVAGEDPGQMDAAPLRARPHAAPHRPPHGRKRRGAVRTPRPTPRVKKRHLRQLGRRPRVKSLKRGVEHAARRSTRAAPPAARTPRCAPRPRDAAGQRRGRLRHRTVAHGDDAEVGRSQPRRVVRPRRAADAGHLAPPRLVAGQYAPQFEGAVAERTRQRLGHIAAADDRHAPYFVLLSVHIRSISRTLPGAACAAAAIRLHLPRVRSRGRARGERRVALRLHPRRSRRTA